MIPLLVAGAGATLQAAYSVGQAIDNYRYWSDYYKNTGFRPKYPFRSGSMASMGYVGGAMSSGFKAYRYLR